MLRECRTYIDWAEAHRGMKEEMKRIALRSTALVTAALLGPVIGLSGVASAAGTTAPTHLLTCASKTTTEPTSYLLSCADANAAFASMKWSTWGSSSARGQGVLRQNDCKPNCVSGKVLSYVTTVTLTKVVDTKKFGPLFSEAYFHYTSHGESVVEKFGLAD